MIILWNLFPFSYLKKFGSDLRDFGVNDQFLYSHNQMSQPTYFKYYNNINKLYIYFYYIAD